MFQQLYYTSCERGLSGYPGYQFNAVTPGVGTAVMREVERLTAYEPPRSLADQSAPTDLTAYPVSLSFAPGDTTIIANVVFAGMDFSRRYGNYFAHALATSTPEADLGPLAPIELWQAPFWRHRVADSLELPPLSGPLAQGPINREAAQAFVASHPSSRLLPTLLSAAARAVSAGTRSVVLVEADAASSAHWIAALSYLLPTPLAQQMSFTTYHHRPGYCGLHVIGTVADADVDLSDGGFDSFYLFDFTSDRCSELEVHPLAELAVRVGAVGAKGLWELACGLATGEESSLDDWYPLATAAAADQRHQLQPVELDTAVGWFASSAHRLDQLAVSRLGEALLEQEGLSPQRHLRGLISAASAAGASSLQERLDNIERKLVDLELAHLSRDELRDGHAPIRLTSEVARAHARKRCEERLAVADLETGLKLLDWAQVAGVRVGEQTLKAWGAAALGPLLVSDPGNLQTSRVAASHPAVLYGVAAHLEQIAPDHPELVEAVVKGGIDELVREEHLAGRPRLRQLILLDRAQRYPEQRVGALVQVLSLRRDRTVDENLLRYLWPDSHWSLAEAREILERLPPEQATTGAVPAWLSATLAHSSQSLDPVQLGSYLALCDTIVTHGIDKTLSEVARRHAREAVWALRGLQHARGPDRRKATAALMNLAQGFGDTGAPTRELLLGRLPELLVRQLPLGDLVEVVAACPQELLWGFVKRVTDELGPQRPDPGLAARVFVLCWQLKERKSPHAKALDQQVLSMTLPSWRRRDLERLVKLLQQHSPEARRAFEGWLRSRQRPPRHGRQKQRQGGGRGRGRQGGDADGDGLGPTPKGVTGRVNEWLRGRKH